ncbi:GNAT family N-acetyltransferase [Devosia sp. A16]|uniref:GNAT family N-acetyltransferase n=1 Tax=Devosia sp. A16 TaxID=1736675 RepID=UPI0006D77BD2|nr:GNAT family N-acetyltransferase [Devosia sp. A16]
MTSFSNRPLTAETWPDFAALVERHNGVWGGCWCMAFHAEGVGKERAPAQNRADKEARVLRGAAHAALVFDGETCVGWCQFGSHAELPRIKARKAYEAEPAPPADWRITCLFVDKTQRRRGVAAAALAGALEEIGRLGGGTVESFPEDTAGRAVSASFLHNGTLEMFEAAGFTRQRRLGKDRWLVRTIVAGR